jgi:hypothetical protein
VRPLSADQLFRSLVLTTGIEAMAKGRFRAQVEDGKLRALREYHFVFDDDEMSDRDSASKGSVTQALLLWNGELTNLGARAQGGGGLAAALAAGDPLEELFLRAYARPPTDAERKRLAPGDRAGWEDLFFAMLTSTEFITNH